MNKLNSRSRNYRLGWTTSVYTPPLQEHWRFVDYGPATKALGASGIIRVYRRLSRENQYNEWSVVLWQGDKVLAEGSEVREAIREYELEREILRQDNRNP
jgi:hypothetical protein